MKANYQFRKAQLFVAVAIVVALFLALSLSRYNSASASQYPAVTVTDRFSIDFSLSSLNGPQQQALRRFLDAHAGELPDDVLDYTVTVQYRNLSGEQVVGLVPTDVYASHWEIPLPENTPVFLTLTESGTNGWSAAFLPKPATPQRSVSADYRFPWTNGHTWNKTQGFHYQNIGFSLDFSSGGNTVLDVRAIESGTLTPRCYIPNDPHQAMVLINHAGGIQSGYLHLSKSSIPAGQFNQSVTAAQVIGQIYTGTAIDRPHPACTDLSKYRFATACGCGYGAHLHFEANQTISIQGNPLSSISSAPNGTGYTSTNGAPPSGDTVIVNPPPINPSAGTCGNGWNQIVGYEGNPAYTTRNAQSSGQSTNSATWVPSIGQAGTYGVEAYVPNHGTAFCGTSVSYDTTNAVYTLTDSNNSQFTKSVNQQPLANVWVSLGDLYCSAGQSCRVRLTDLTGETFLSRTVSFSAVRFTLKSTPPPTYSISGSITTGNGAGLPGVNVSAGGKTVQTDGNGNYAISELPASVYTVTPQKAEYTFSPGDKSVTLSANATGINFTASPLTYSIRGRVIDGANSSGISGAAVSAGGKTVQTDGNGNYTISDLLAGPYTVSANKSGYSFTPTSRNVTLGPDANGVDFVGTTVTYSIKGRVTVGGAALSGVSVSAGGKNAQTDANGNYTLSSLGAGTYQVIPSKTGYTFNPTSRNVTIGTDAVGVDFAGTATQTGDTRMFINPPNQTAALGSGEFCLQLRAEKSSELHAFEFTLGFPPDLLEGTRVTLGSFLGSSGRVATPLGPDIDNAAGQIKFGAYTNGNSPGPTGDGELATVCFTPEKAGAAALNLTVGKLSGPNGATIPASLTGGSVTITSCYFADFDCNNEVDILDVQQVAGRWGQKADEPDSGFEAKYDVVASGEIDVFDVQKVASVWGWPDNRAAVKRSETAAALTFSIDPTDLNLKVGETRLIALEVTGAQNLGAFEIKLNYDPALIRVNSVGLTDFLESTGRQAIVLGPEIDNSAGQVRFGAATIGSEPGVTGSEHLALIEVTALSVGNGHFDLNAGRASNPAAEPMTVSLIDGSYHTSEGATGDQHRVTLPVILNRP